MKYDTVRSIEGGYSQIRFNQPEGNGHLRVFRTNKCTTKREASPGNR